MPKPFVSSWVKTRKVDNGEVTVAHQNDNELCFIIQCERIKYQIRAERKEKSCYEGTWSYTWWRKALSGKLNFTLYQSDDALLLFGNWHEDGEHDWWIKLPKAHDFGSSRSKITITPEGSYKSAKLVEPKKAETTRVSAHAKPHFKDTGAFAGEFSVEANAFSLVANRFIIRDAEVAFDFYGLADEHFSGECKLTRAPEGGTYPTELRYRCKDRSESHSATIRIERINEAENGCEVIGRWTEDGEDWEFRGELDRIHTGPSSG